MARRSNIHTVYHVMEEKGYFERNTANRDARDQVTGESTYKGPVAYPRMMFHPQGAEKIIVPAEIIVTPMGPQRVGEQRQLVYKIVQDAAEEASLKALGWHSKARFAVRARMQIEGKDPGMAMPLSKDDKIADLAAQIAILQAEKLDREAKQLAENRAGGGIVMPKAKEVAEDAGPGKTMTSGPLPDPARMGL